MRGFFSAFFGLLLLATPVFAQPTYDLRGPGPKKGDVLLNQSKLTMPECVMVLKVNGQEIKITQNMTIQNEEEETYLEVTDRQVVKSRTKILKDLIKTQGQFAGQDINEEKKGDLEGEIVSTERTKDGKWKHSLIDGKPNDEQKKALDQRDGPENTDDIYPAEAVKIGHAWEVDAAKIKSLTGNSFTDVSGKMKLKFLRVEKLGGEECAVIETQGTMKGKMKGDDVEQANAELKIKSLGWLSLKTGIEVKSQFEGTMKLSGKMKIEGEEVEMKMEGPIKGTNAIKKK
jgi:hypothetical protein